MPKPTKSVPTDLAVTPEGKVATGVTRGPSSPHPKLVNRGPAGLLHKIKKVGGELKEEVVPEKAQLTKATAKHRIAPALLSLVVEIDTVIPDPENARLHPDRNLEAIKDSLRLYGQVKPIVVRKSNSTVVAGNGTLAAAKSLGWTDIAATFVDMNHVEAAGYGLADNRTAELAMWDFKAIARLDKILLEAGAENVGWTADELKVLRAAEWVKPQIQGVGGGNSGEGEMDPEVHVLKLTVEQQAALDKAAKALRSRQGPGETEHPLGECLRLVCLEWLGEGEIEGTEIIEESENREVEQLDPAFAMEGEIIEDA